MAKRAKKVSNYLSPNNPLSDNKVPKPELVQQPDSAKSSPARPQLDVEQANLDIEAQLADLEELTLDTTRDSDKEMVSAVRSVAAEGEGRVVIVHDEVTYTCDVEVIPHPAIEETTVVAKENQRKQQWLTRIALAEMISSILENGQIYPALSHRVNGRIVVVDGSSRRMSCIFGGASFTTLVSDKPFPPSLVKKLTVNANVHRPISIMERAIEWNDYMGNNNCSQAVAAAHFGVNTATLSIGMKSIEIPNTLLDCFPSPADIGKATVTALAKVIKGLSNEDIINLVTAFSQKIENREFNSNLPQECNKQALQILNSLVSEMNLQGGKASTDTKLVVNRSFGNKNVRGSFTVDDKDKVKLSMNKPSQFDVLSAIQAISKECLKDSEEVAQLNELVENMLAKRKH